MELHPFQKQALTLLSKPFNESMHLLCISPTGSGKSLIFEKESQKKNRKVLIVTPLVALARQQFEKLKNLDVCVQLGIGGIANRPPTQESSGVWITSPEMLQHPSRLQWLSCWRPNLLVVDECHCLWEWGESFRPSFRLLPHLLNQYKIMHSLWLTATLPYEAKQELKKEIIEPLHEIGEFDLPAQVYISICQIPWTVRSQQLIRWILEQKEPGIVFVNTRGETLRIARLLEAAGKKTISYHGGLSVEERSILERQVNEKKMDVIVATSAFGMGVHYPFLSYVVLWQPPTSILSLVQAIGRVGRNQEKKSAAALILWDEDDFKLLEWTVKNSERKKKELFEVLNFLRTFQCRKKMLKFYFHPEKPHSFSHQPCLRCDYCLSTLHQHSPHPTE